MQAAIIDLQRSGIEPADAERSGMFPTENAATIFAEFRAEPAIVIPYFDISGQLMRFTRNGQSFPFCRVRYLGDAVAARGFTKSAKIPKYGQPVASGVRAYLTPIIDWRAKLTDVKEPLIITEGEKKAVAAALHGLPVIALGGVFNFMETADSLLRELDVFAWRGRDAYIVFDSDAVSNPDILTAEARLVEELQRKRGARCFLVRLPQDGDSKVGIDDFLLAHGAPAFITLLQGAAYLGGLDAKVVALNKSVAWIEKDGLVYDLARKEFMQKEHFCNGSLYSSLTHITTGGAQRAAPKVLSVARAWLTHPHAQRYGEILFRPGEGTTVLSDKGATSLNIWGGFDAKRGDVTPFLKLTDYLMQHSGADMRDFPLKLMAYKAQNPARKIPLALMFVGDQGTGKSLWCECIAKAFAPYSESIDSAMFHGQFRGWLERTLIAFIDEIETEHIQRGGAVLKNLITAEYHPMNEKFRAVRQVKSFTQYLMTTNERGAASFAGDDRRMVVVGTPAASERLAPEFYDSVHDWREKGGAQALMAYLLDYPLAGWKPPASPPLSAEKYMAFVEGLTVVQKLADDMRTADFNTVKLWLDSAMGWANQHLTSSNPSVAGLAVASAENIGRFPIRPFYSPEELALIFPSVMANLQGTKFAKSTSAGQISRELRDAGVPFLLNSDDPRGFKYKGLLRQFLVVAQFDDWREPITQEYFDNIVANAPSYAQVAGVRGLKR